MDATAKENACQINRHQRCIKDFEKQDQRLLKRSMRNRKVCRERHQHRFVFQLVNLINGIYTRQQLDQLRRDLT